MPLFNFGSVAQFCCQLEKILVRARKMTDEHIIISIEYDACNEFFCGIIFAFTVQDELPTVFVSLP